MRIPYEGALLTACFCCECCCLSQGLRKGPLETVKGIMHPVKGLSAEVTGDGIGCDQCESTSKERGKK